MLDPAAHCTAMIRISIDPSAPRLAALGPAVAAICGGGIVAYPTDTLYGLGADPFDADAVERIFAVKGRGADRALPLVAADRAQVEALLGELPPRAAALADRFWPGPLTLLLPAPARLAAAVTAGTGRVGIRVPAHAVARLLCEASQRLVTATSANVSGQPPAADPDTVAASIGARIDVLVDGGPTSGGAPSTIVDVAVTPPRLVRAGAIPWEEVEAWLGR
jgi:L-threonylcarbamoyladenylate synthase